MSDVVALLDQLIAELRRHPGDPVAEAWVKHFTRIDRSSLQLWALKHADDPAPTVGAGSST